MGLAKRARAQQRHVYLPALRRGRGTACVRKLLDLKSGVGLLAMGHVAFSTGGGQGLSIGRGLFHIARGSVLRNRRSGSLGLFREVHRIGRVTLLPEALYLLECI